jgi:hypothetical protein
VPALTAAKLPRGAAARRSELSPQHSSEWSGRIPHAWFLPTLTLPNLPSGGMPIPLAQLLGQQVTAPVDRIPQPATSPMSMSVTPPVDGEGASGEGTPLYALIKSDQSHSMQPARPQHMTYPEASSPQACSSPACTLMNRAVWGPLLSMAPQQATV